MSTIRKAGTSTARGSKGKKKDEEETKAFLPSSFVVLERDDDDLAVERRSSEKTQQQAHHPAITSSINRRWTTTTSRRQHNMLLISILLLLAMFSMCNNLKKKKGTTTTTTSSSYYSKELMDSYRRRLVSVSIQLMKDDTEQVSQTSQTVDISEYVKFINEALDEFGLYAITQDLFEPLKFIDATNSYVNDDEEEDPTTIYDPLHAYWEPVSDHEPMVEYTTIPNNRKFANGPRMCTGCYWWLNHWLGAIVGDRFLKDGKILWIKKGRYLTTGREITQELVNIEKLNRADPLPYHIQHGFAWHILSEVLPNLKDEYPLNLVESHCGFLPSEDLEHNFMTAVVKNLEGGCRHGFGHAVFHLIAYRQNQTLEEHSVEIQVRPMSTFDITRDTYCEGYRICMSAPSEWHANRCLSGITHNIKIATFMGRHPNVTKEIRQWKRFCAESFTPPQFIPSN